MTILGVVDGDRFSIDGVSLVGTLLFCCSPTYVAWYVTFGIVDAIAGVSFGGSWTHLFEPSFEPGVTTILVEERVDTNVALAVVLVAIMLWVLRTIMHHHPTTIFRCIVGLDGLPFATAVLFRIVGADKVIRGYGFAMTADTFHSNPFLKVRGRRSRIISYPLDNC